MTIFLETKKFDLVIAEGQKASAIAPDDPEINNMMSIACLKVKHSK